MKIAFICGGLEPGRDGVGDYTRRLASEVIKNGHSVIAIALNDKSISVVSEGIEDVDGTELDIFRIPSLIGVNDRFSHLAQIIARFDLDWISLQFVPYSFHQKGLPVGFFRQLKAVRTKAKWHVMLHEIWLDKAENIRQEIIKVAQKAIIGFGIKYHLSPEVINVSIQYNAKRLSKAFGIRSKVLSLFGNISGDGDRELPYVVTTTNGEYLYKILYFGGPARGGYLNQVVSGLEKFCELQPGKVQVIVASGNSSEKDSFISALKQRLEGHDTLITDCGFITSEQISGLLAYSTIGIARSEAYFLGKSGTAVAMLEHGLPLWLPKWNGSDSIDFHFRKELIFPDLNNAAKCSERKEYQSLLPAVTKQFLNELLNNK